MVRLLLYSYAQLYGAVAPSYEVDGIGGRLDPVPEVPTLLYIGRRGRVTERTIRPTVDEIWPAVYRGVRLW